MRKILFVLLVGLLMLAGCGSNPQENNEKPINQATSIADLAGKKIAGQAGTFHYDVLDQIDNVVKFDYPEFTDLLIALQSHAIDGYVAEEPTAVSVCEANANLTYIPLVNNVTGFTTSSEDTAIAVGLKKGSELREQINAVLATITADQRLELMNQMVQLTTGQNVETLALEIVDVNPAEAKGVLRIGMECAYEPYNWTETAANSIGCVPISGEGKEGLYCNGYDVQIARYIAGQLGYTLEVYSIEWDSLIPAVQSGAVDGIIAGMSPTAQRAQTIDFTDNYFESNLVIIINK